MSRGDYQPGTDKLTLRPKILAMLPNVIIAVQAHQDRAGERQQKRCTKTCELAPECLHHSAEYPIPNCFW